ncbi:hypothetical protein HOK00_00185 [bacterium]|jgi:hypothetical protein|nr:hypothetical protein [bacterium]
MTFSIYGVKFIFKNAPKKIVEYFTNEWNLFKDIKENGNIIIKINFSHTFNIDNDTKLFSSTLAYSNGSLYLFKNQQIHLKLLELKDNIIHISCKNSITGIELFWLLERILFLKLISLGYTLQHASCFKINNTVFAFSSLKETGKSKILMYFLQSKDQIEFISDDVLILDENFVALPYPRGISVHKYHGNIFYKLLGQSNIKVKVRYLIHLLKEKIFNRIEKFIIRLYLHNFIKKISTIQNPIDKFYILEKHYQSNIIKQNMDLLEVENFLTRNIQMEFFGIFYEDFFLMNFINNREVEIFQQYLEYLHELLKENQHRFSQSIDVEKIVVDNDFDISNLKKVILNG